MGRRIKRAADVAAPAAERGKRMNRKQYKTIQLKRQEWIWMNIGLGVIGVFLGVAAFCAAVLLFSPVCA